jgi:hypothetical protein
VPGSIVLLLIERWVKALGIKVFSTAQWHNHDAPLAVARHLAKGKNGTLPAIKGSMTSALASGRQGSAMLN